jgi:hypothetical protein
MRDKKTLHPLPVKPCNFTWLRFDGQAISLQQPVRIKHVDGPLFAPHLQSHLLRPQALRKSCEQLGQPSTFVQKALDGVCAPTDATEQNRRPGYTARDPGQIDLSHQPLAKVAD